MAHKIAFRLVCLLFLTRTYAFIRKNVSPRVSINGIKTPACSVNAKAKLRYRDAEEMIEMLQGDNSSLVVLLFTAVNCGPCRLQKQELQRLNDTRKSRLEQANHITPEEGDTQRDLDRLPLKVLTIDTERWPHVGSKFQIGKLPCLFLFRGNVTIRRLEGLVSAEEIWKHVVDYHHPSDGAIE